MNKAKRELKRRFLYLDVQHEILADFASGEMLSIIERNDLTIEEARIFLNHHLSTAERIDQMFWA